MSKFHILKTCNKTFLKNQILKSFLNSPARVSILGFICLITTGTFLLMLPVSSKNSPLNFIDALFTATSASCVTGLSVIDINNFLSLFGQIVLLGLIQIGGLGIMTISTLFILLAGKKSSLIEKNIIQDTYTHGGKQTPYEIVKNIILFTIVFEVLGITFLTFCFLPSLGLEKGFYFAVFHSISAFCNAGFSLFSNSLSNYNVDWGLNIIVCFLIISGGIGFFVLSELKSNFPYTYKRWRRLTLHTKLVITTTCILIIISVLSIIVMEWNNTLASLSVPQKFLVSFFQAVSSRTAGFNTVNIAYMANETLFVFIILMFIGASPGSCGGGIKTTTIATLFLLGKAKMSGNGNTQVYWRTIPSQSVAKAVNVFIISMVIIVITIMLMLMVELGEVSHLESRGKFIEFMFEVVSAFGTVGLSIGITASLSIIGKIIIIVVMFIGRLGPLLIAIAISRNKISKFYYAEENIMIG